MGLAWFKSNWRWSALNVLALSVLFIVLTQGSTDWNDMDAFDSMLASGKWAIRFLLGCLLAACGSADQPGATATTEDLWIVFPDSRAEEMRIGAWLSSEADYGNFFCTDSGMNWTYEWIFILDGGDCYFQLQFDVESSTFTELTVNGEA